MMNEYAEIAGQLTFHCFKIDVAGDEAFLKAVRAIKDAKANGRGILVLGKVGCGKTTFAHAAAKILFGLGAEYKFVECGVETELKRWFEPEGKMNELLSGRVVLDDIGAEEVDIDYGKRRDRIGQFLTSYERVWSRINYPMPIIVTSNLSIKELTNRYGGRVIDRLLGITVVFTMPGKSKRVGMVV